MSSRLISGRGFLDCRHPLRGLGGVFAGPRVRGLTRGYLPSPASRVRRVFVARSTGSRTHPWLYAVTRFAGQSSLDAQVVLHYSNDSVPTPPASLQRSLTEWDSRLFIWAINPGPTTQAIVTALARLEKPSSSKQRGSVTHLRCSGQCRS